MLGGLYGVVELDECVARVVGEVVGGLAGGGIRERRGRRRGLGRLRPVPAAPPRQHVGAAADQRDPSDDEPDRQSRTPRVATRAARRLAGTHPVGERDRGAGPVVGGQARTDVAGLDVRDDLVGERKRLVERDAVGAVVDRDGQQCVAPAELRRLSGAVRPVLTVAAGEVLDVDDVQAQVGLGRQPVQRRLHGRGLRPEGPRGVGDLSGHPQRGLGRGRRAAERQQPEHQRRHRGHSAHVHPRIRLPFCRVRPSRRNLAHPRPRGRPVSRQRPGH